MNPRCVACVVLSGLFSLTTVVLPGDRLEPEQVPPDWMATVQQEIAAAEYHVTWQEASQLPDVTATWQAPNRAHDLRSFFTASGVRVVRRTESEPTWNWSLSLLRVGRPGALEDVGAARLSVFDNRIDYERGGEVELREWYLNGERGVEQLFSIARRPEVEGHLLYIDIAVGGTLHAVLAEDRQSFDFQTIDGRRRIHYGHLKVTDATGRVLRSWMEGFADEEHRGIRLVVDDGGAQYPLEVDPLYTTPAWTASPGSAGEHFAYSVAAAGDVNGDGYSDVVIGAPDWDYGSDGTGRVFIYHGSASGLGASWAWASDSSMSGGDLGFSVATAGDVDADGYSDVLAGRPTLSDAVELAGGWYIFFGGPNGIDDYRSHNWGMANSLCGFAVSTAGDVNWDGLSDVIIGAPGAAQVVVYEGAQNRSLQAAWSRTTTPGPDSDNNFGSAVGFAGDVNRDGHADIVLGDPWNHTAMVWQGSQTGLSPPAIPDWTVTSSGYFGQSVSTAGDVNRDGCSDILVGAPFEHGSTSLEGRAYLFLGSLSGLSNSPDWSISGESGDRLGLSVSTAGDINGDDYADVVIGSPYHSNDESYEGKALVYHGNETGLSFLPAWQIESDYGSALYGRSVATAGDVNGDGYSDVLIGAPNYGTTFSGRAYVYHGSPAGLGWVAWSVESDQAYASLGASVSTAGDVNGDAYDDVIVGVPNFDGGQENEGRVYVYYGNSLGVDADWSFYRESQQVNGRLGKRVAAAGDVNGDGYGDIIVGAPGYTNGESSEGRVYVYTGSASGLAYHWRAESNVEYGVLGDAVGWAGDVNGDGYSDIIVGAPGYDAPTNAEGGAFVWHGGDAGLGADGTPANADWSAESNQEFANLGASVATAGDVNADGYSDVLVGAIYYDDGQSAEGKVFAWFGSYTGLGEAGTPLNANWAVASGQQDAHLGRSVASAGDVNRDGYADVIVGASGWDRDTPALNNAGRADLYLGSGSGLLSTSAFTMLGGQEGEWLGFSVAGIGDANGDGHADIAVGRPYYASGAGAVTVHFGSAIGFSGETTIVGTQDGAHFGYSVAPAGDVNSDGYADLIAGMPEFGNSATDAGIALVFLGNEGQARSIEPAQRSPGGGPIGRLGSSSQADSFELAMIGHPFLSRVGTIRLEIEVRKLGEPLDGSEIRRDGQWVGVSGSTPLSRQLTDLDSNYVYHWRVRTGQSLIHSPYQPWGRWVVRPWGGISEGRLRLWLDSDSDQVDDRQDNCPAHANTDQLDSDGDGVGNACDNCSAIPNPGQENNDGDPLGDICDPDDDNDGRDDGEDNCPFDYNPGQDNHDGDSMGDACDPDDDDDGWDDDVDCLDLDGSVWSVPSPPTDLRLSKAASDNLSWSAPVDPGSTSISYDVLFSPSPSDWSSGTASCVETNETDRLATAGANPGSGLRFCYLVRSENPCGGNMSVDSSSVPRVGRSCP